MCIDLDEMLYNHPHVAFCHPNDCSRPIDPPLSKPWNKNHGVELNDVGGCLNKRVIVNCRAELLSGFRYSSLIISKREEKKRKKGKRFERVYIKNGPLRRKTFRGCVTERRRSHQVFGWKVNQVFSHPIPPTSRDFLPTSPAFLFKCYLTPYMVSSCYSIEDP